MERLHVSHDKALATLISASRRREVALHQLSRDIIAGGEL